MKLRYLVICMFIFQLFFARVIEGEFEMAKEAYEQEQYKIAEVYLDILLREKPFSEYSTDATYYLIKIYDKRGDFVKLFSKATYFLDNYIYDYRCKEVFHLILEKLIEKGSFTIAYDFIKEYDYLISDDTILEKVGHGLFRLDRMKSAEYIFSLCRQTDTIRILRAAIAADFLLKKELYKSINGIKGKIYVMELLLENGDTIEVYEIYRSIKQGDVKDDILYRHAKISRLFDENNFMESVKRLNQLAEYRNKAQLLEALSSHDLKRLVIPHDREEWALLSKYLREDTIPRNPPSNVNIHDFDMRDENVLQSIREKVGENYYLDSSYCRFLLDNARIYEALSVIAPYIDYQNTKKYARKIRALKYYDETNYELAAKDIILAQADEPEMLFVLADALTHIGKNASYIYRRIVGTSSDTMLTAQATKELIRLNFENALYEEVVKHSFDVFQNDTSLVRIYIYSLARLGKKREADLLFSQFFANQDYDFTNYYGEYLIDEKKYTKADDYYDSLIHSEDGIPSDRVYYNWALIPFLRGEMGTALRRFTFYISERRDGEEYYKALFKIATINYIKNHFDSAAFYYGLASRDELLCDDAMQNQLICYKKSGNWEKAIEVGKRILLSVPEDGRSNVQFDIGYAYLRSGNARNAIEYLKMAAAAESTPEFHYWLGEAYLTKADFSRALYQYQKIVQLFPEDDMWTPTAHYKTGIVLEFIDELAEARKVYERIIKEWGIDDTWGIEAQKRLKEIR